MENKGKYFSEIFRVALLISVVVIFSTLLAASFVGFDVPADIADQIASDVESQAATTTWQDIFINNFGLTLITSVPFLGFAFEVYIQFNTGYVFGALAQAYGVNNVEAVLVTLATPIGVLEYLSYLLASSESLVLAYLVYKGKLKDRLVNHTWKTIILVVVLLIFAAIVEAAFMGRL